MTTTVRTLTSRTYTVHAEDPKRPEYFLCKTGSRFGAPVVVGGGDKVTPEQFGKLGGTACKSCRRAVGKLITTPSPALRSPLSFPPPPAEVVHDRTDFVLRPGEEGYLPEIPWAWTSAHRQDATRMPFRARQARNAAYLGMCATASRMDPIDYARGHPKLRYTDPVAYADLRTSMDDYRAALSIAAGKPLEHLDRDGYDVSSPSARAHVEAREAQREVRRFPIGFGHDEADARAARHAVAVMTDAADAMSWAHHQSRDTVALADARTSLDDARAALALAYGVGAEEPDRPGPRKGSECSSD